MSTLAELLGQSGVTIELNELQAAAHGRKFASVDRRPLDPPPIVQMRIVRAPPASEELADYSALSLHGTLCCVDLLACPEAAYSIPATPPGGLHGALHPEGLQQPPSAPPPPATLPPDGTIAGPADDRVDGAALDGHAVQTDQLFGTKVVQAMRLNRLGEQLLVFVFGDLAVRQEGLFRLRYRIVDVLAGAAPHPVLATHAGAPFRIWPSKDFPGLTASTELTKLVAAQGASVHMRQKEPARRREP